jgi:hypothetical protein
VELAHSNILMVYSVLVIENETLHIRFIDLI